MKKIALFACVAVLGGVQALAVVIRVSPGAGALERARGSVRKLLAENGGRPPQDGIAVVLADGHYVLAAPLELTTADSGSAERPVVWRAEHRGRAVFTGRAPLGETQIDWTRKPASLVPAAARAHVRCWQLPGEAALPGFYAGGCCARPDLEDNAICVFSGGERAVPARWPNGRFARTGKPIGEAKDEKSTFGRAVKKINSGVFRLRNAPLAAWAEEPDLWAYGMYGMEWSDISSPVLRADPVAGTLAVEPSKNPYGFKANMPFFVFNAFSELDREGEWAVDRTARRLYLWGRTGQPPLVAGPDTLLTGRDVSGVVFDGLVLEVARGTGASFLRADGVVFRASCVRRTGGDGIVFADSTNCRVEGCDLYDLGKAGVRTGNGKKEQFARGGNVVDNCHIHHYGRIIPNYNPGIGLTGCGNRATHNLVHHSPHQGISFNGNDHYIGFNVCHDCCSFTDDAGTIYCCMRDWTKRGTVIEYNAIHMTGKQPYAKHVRGIYLDDWTCGTVLRGNIINRAPQAVYAGGGSANVVTRNVLVNAPDAVCIGTRGLDSFAKATTLQGAKSFLYKKYLKGKATWKPDLWRARYPHLAEIESLPPVEAHNAYFNEVSNNVCVATRGVRLQNEKAIRGRTTVADNLETDGDPGFVDYAGFDWELRPDSPARKILGGGTRFGEMGLYASDSRFSPAVKHGEGMTPPRPFGIEKEPAQAGAYIAVGKRKLDYFAFGEMQPEWAEFEFSVVPDVSGAAQLRLTHKAEWAPTEYAAVTANGRPLRAEPDAKDVYRLEVRAGEEVTVTLRARCAPSGKDSLR